MLFDLEDYATTYRTGCMDRRATNYNPTANIPCENCCRYNTVVTEGYWEEATIDGTNPISEECCKKLNVNNSSNTNSDTINFSDWRMVTDKDGIKRCVRSSYTKSLYE
jgi:hypothetical protein